jgi:hypothetical protein
MEPFLNNDDGNYITMSNPIESLIESASIEQLKALIENAKGAIEQKKGG